MKQIPFLSKLYHGICKDTGSQNESAKVIVVTRILTLIMMFYSAANTVITALTSKDKDLYLPLISLILFAAVFAMSYFCKPFTAYCVLNVYTLLWIILNVRFYGWDIGVQHLMIPLLVFAFFAKYGHEPIKILYVIVLFALRIYLFNYCKLNTPVITIANEIVYSLQVINTLTVFGSLTLIANIFSKDSQALEGKLVEYNEQLIEQASIDPLTGLHNRRSTTKYLEKLLKNPSSPISICICDIDFFKKVNDTYGHDVGDVVLETISKTFKKALPSGCFLSRWGGEEFLLIFPQNNGDEALYSLEELRQKIKSLTFQSGENTFRISMTYGLAEYDYQGDVSAILKEADEKLYYGKEHGRDQIVF